MPSLGATVLRKHLDAVPLWRGNHVAVKQLAEDFARYLYLPRVAGPEVIAQSVRAGVALLTWEMETFAYAESFDEAASRYRGLQAAHLVAVDAGSSSLIVRPDVARRQIDAEVPAPSPATPPAPGGAPDTAPGPGGQPPAPRPPERTLRRFHGTVSLDPARVGRDAARIAEEVIAHLSALAGTQVTVTLEIEAGLPDGASDQIVRTVTENSRTLKFSNYGFEEN